MPGSMPAGSVDLAATGQLQLQGSPQSAGILCVSFARDVQFSCFKMPGPNLFDASIVKFGKGGQKSGLFGALGLSSDSIIDAFRKIAQAGAVTQCSASDIFGHGLGDFGRSSGIREYS